jgi:hypothetical protein
MAPTSSPRTLTRVRGKASILDWPEGPRRSGQGAGRVSGLDLVPVPGSLSMRTLGSSVWKTWSNQRVPHKTAGSRESTRAAGAQRLSDHRAAVRSPPPTSSCRACRSVSSRVSRIQSPGTGGGSGSCAGRKARGPGACPPRPISDQILGRSPACHEATLMHSPAVAPISLAPSTNDFGGQVL